MEVAFHSQDFRYELYPVSFELDKLNSEDRLQIGRTFRKYQSLKFRFIHDFNFGRIHAKCFFMQNRWLF